MLALMTGDSSWLDTMPELYDRCLGPTLFAPYAQRVASMAAAYEPHEVLELAAGTGIVTTELVRALPGASIVATDLNPAMVALAGARVSGPTWRVADAQSLDFPPATFDLIVCQFGVMFFPDKPAAFAQAARVLRPGGHYVFTVWDRVDRSRFPTLMAALAELLPLTIHRTSSPASHTAITTRSRSAPTVAAGGLALEDIERVELRGIAASARTLAEGFCFGTPLRFGLQARGDLSELADAVAERDDPAPGPRSGGEVVVQQCVAVAWFSSCCSRP